MARLGFIWNQDIGRRSRVNIKAGKNIRRRSDGLELFEDYWTDSELEECISDDDVSNKSAFGKSKKSSSPEQKELTLSIESAKNTSSKELSPLEKENVSPKKNEDFLKTKVQAENANKCAVRDSAASLSKDDRIQTSAKRNLTSSFVKNIVQTPSPSKRKDKTPDSKYTKSASKQNETRYIERKPCTPRKTLCFSDDEPHTNKSIQENVTPNIRNKERSVVNAETVKVSDDVQKSFNVIPVSGDNAASVAKMLDLTICRSFSDDDDDDDDIFSFVLTNKSQKINTSKLSLNNIKEVDNIKNIEREKVTRKAKSGKFTLKDNQKQMLSVSSINSSDNGNESSIKKTGRNMRSSATNKNNSSCDHSSQTQRKIFGTIFTSSTPKDDKKTRVGKPIAEVGEGSPPVSVADKEESYIEAITAEEQVARIHNAEIVENPLQDDEIVPEKEADVVHKSTKKRKTNPSKRNVRNPLPNISEDKCDDKMVTELNSLDNCRRKDAGELTDKNKKMHNILLATQNKNRKTNIKKISLEKSGYSADNENARSDKYHSVSNERLESMPHSKKRSKSGKSQKEFLEIAITENSLPSDDNNQSENGLSESDSFCHKATVKSNSLNNAKKGKNKENLKISMQRKAKYAKQRNEDALNEENESYHLTKLQLNEKLNKDKNNRKRKFSPKKQNIKKSYEAKIISPPPIRQPTPGVRRSSRVRVKPLEYWRNQRLRYERSENCFAIKGIEQGFDDDPFTIYRHQKRKRHMLEKKTENTKSLKKSNDISVHDLSALASYNIDEEPNTVIPVRCLETDSEMSENVVSIHDSLEWTRMDESSSSNDNKVAIAVSIRLPNAATGYIKIDAFQEKKLQYMPNNSALYVILYGKLLIQINSTTFVLKTGDAFRVPRGNAYSIKNLRRDEAELYFTVFWSSEMNDEESDVKC